MHGRNAPVDELFERIVDALQGKPSSAEIGALIEESNLALDELRVSRGVVEGETLDPMTPMDKVHQKRKELSDLSFTSSRLEVAIERLRGAQATAAEREEQIRRLEAHAQAQAMCELAAENMTRLSDQWHSALKQAARAVEMVRAVNAALPDGAAPLTIPEPCADEQIVSAREVERWCYPGSLTTFDDSEVSADVERPSQPGVLRTRHPFVARRLFREVVFTPRGSTEQHTRYEAMAQPEPAPEPMGTPASERDHGFRKSEHDPRLHGTVAQLHSARR